MDEDEFGNHEPGSGGDEHPESGSGQEEEWTSDEGVELAADDHPASQDFDDADAQSGFDDVDLPIDDSVTDGPEAPDGFEASEPADAFDPSDQQVSEIFMEPATVGLCSTDLFDAVVQQIPVSDVEAISGRIAEFVDEDDLGLGLDARGLTRLFDTSGVDSIIEYGSTALIEERVESGQVVLVGGAEEQWTIDHIDGAAVALRGGDGGSLSIERAAFDTIWEQSTTEIIEIRPDMSGHGAIRFDEHTRIVVLPMTITDQ